MPRRRVERLARFARPLADALPLTGGGALLAALAGGSLWVYGYGALDLVVFTLGSAGLALTGLCILAVVAAALRLRREDGGGETLGRLEAGARVVTGFGLPSLARLPLLQLDWSWSEPPGIACRVRVGRERCEEEVVARVRGEAKQVVRRFVVRDAFGLAAVAWQRARPGSLWILPATGALRRVALLHSLAGSEGISHPAGAPEGDRMEIRRYVPGDSPRHILWKAYARTGQLNVRMPERSLERAERTLAYLVAGPDDEAAAAAARVALEGGALGREWIFGADGSEEPAQTLPPALRAIARSGAARWRQNGGAGLAAFLREAAGGSSCIVFAPGRPGPWTERVLALAREHPGGLVFVLAIDGLAPSRVRKPAWRRALFVSEGTDAAPAAEHAQLLRQVATTGSVVHVVDRVTGRSFSPALQRAMRMSA